ncbi:hypothetical protein XH80_19825 [Bradyrhizobium sp. CCBAU 45384]|nr:hypothetical protein [Bradyrhizobium sp. CCBAU 45384]
MLSSKVAFNLSNEVTRHFSVDSGLQLDEEEAAHTLKLEACGIGRRRLLARDQRTSTPAMVRCWTPFAPLKIS